MINKRASTLNEYGFLRLGLVVPDLRVADVAYNTDAIIAALKTISGQGCQMALFPDLCITGYTCGDLFWQSLLLEKSCQALLSITRAVNKYQISTFVGLPLMIHGHLFKASAFIDPQGLEGIVLKKPLSYDEQRWFTDPLEFDQQTLLLDGLEVPLGTNLIFQARNMPECAMWVENSLGNCCGHSSHYECPPALATILLNTFAYRESPGMADSMRENIRFQSKFFTSISAFVSNGLNESSSDGVYSGAAFIAENGDSLAEATQLRFDTQSVLADVDLQRIVQQRLACRIDREMDNEKPYRLIQFDLPSTKNDPLSKFCLREISQTPFVPRDTEKHEDFCREAFTIQSSALARRMKHIGVKTVVLGLSGGMDSSLALLVCVHVFKLLSYDIQGILAVSLPGPGSSIVSRDHTRQLAGMMGVKFREIPIDQALAQHFDDIGHDPQVFDHTYENAQARERIQILMDLANQTGGFVVGTGDLSEIALGWCTYNADQMSMYHVNAGVPKTLVRAELEWYADVYCKGQDASLIYEICAKPISPELMPLDQNQTSSQKTEELIGPFILHDFYLFYLLKFGFSPKKIFALAQQAFFGMYSEQEILHWMKVFYDRFILQQYKRSAAPDGPRVFEVGLSPHKDWCMPSDASPALWLESIQKLEEEIRVGEKNHTDD
jgi:NAD+ synthase (glutamine-hydrolysing)